MVVCDVTEYTQSTSPLPMHLSYRAGINALFNFIGGYCFYSMAGFCQLHGGGFSYCSYVAVRAGSPYGPVLSNSILLSLFYTSAILFRTWQ